METKLTARKINRFKFDLFLNDMTVPFGTLVSANGINGWAFDAEDEELDFDVNTGLRTGWKLPEVLAHVRLRATYLWDSRDAESIAEMEAENAWLRALEDDPEAREQMEREDMLCPW